MHPLLNQPRTNGVAHWIATKGGNFADPLEPRNQNYRERACSLIWTETQAQYCDIG